MWRLDLNQINPVWYSYAGLGAVPFPKTSRDCWCRVAPEGVDVVNGENALENKWEATHSEGFFPDGFSCGGDEGDPPAHGDLPRVDGAL